MLSGNSAGTLPHQCDHHKENKDNYIEFRGAPSGCRRGKGEILISLKFGGEKPMF